MSSRSHGSLCSTGPWSGEPSSTSSAPPDSGSGTGTRRTGSTVRVLMVDDEELIRKMAAGMARRIQVELMTAATAREALEIAGTTLIDVLIADVLLGEGLDGIDLARQIGATNPEMKVILMSGYSPTHFDLEGLPPGTQFLLKPFNSESLARSIAAARESRASRHR